MKYPKIRPLGHEDTDGILSMGTVVILEKIDGANFRWKLHENGNLLFGSRKTLFKEHGEPAPFDRINKSFRPAVQEVKDTVDIDVLRDILTDTGSLWFFGESLHKHTLNYDAWNGRHPDIESEIPNYLGFDVYAEEDSRFLSHSEVVDIHEKLNLSTVPLINRGDASEFTVESITVPESKYRTPDPDADNEFDKKGLAEGVVIKNTDLDLRAKLVADKFEETHDTWTANTPKEVSEARRIANIFTNQYATDARIQKIANKLVDEGKYDQLEMGMMQDLPRRVAEDIFAEHGWELLNNDELTLDKLSKEEIRSKLSKKCSRVLTQAIQVSENN